MAADKTTTQWYEDGLSLLELGFFDSAIECFDHVVRVEPRNSRAWTLRATALAGMESFEEAIGSFDRALEVDSRNVQAWNGKALCLTKLGRNQEAARCQAELRRIAEGVEVRVSPAKEPVTTLYTVADGLATDSVCGIDADEEEAWFAYCKETGATRLTLRDQRLRTYTQEDGLTSDLVTCVAVGDKGVWLGTDRGLSRFDRETEKWSRYTPDRDLGATVVNDLAIDGEFVWLATDLGLLVLDMNTGRSVFCEGGPDPAGVDCLLPDAEHVWCGASGESGGVWVFDKQKETYQRLDVGPFVQGLELFPLDGIQKLWVAREEGITILDRITYESEEILLPGMVIAGIATGVNNLLISTARGLAVVHVEGSGADRKVAVERTDIGRGKYVHALCASRTREWMGIEGEGVLCLSYYS